MVKLVSKPMQASQKAVKPLPAKVGKQPGKLVAPKSKPKTKVVKKATPKKGKKITGMNHKSKLKGKPVTKGKVKGLVRSIK